MSKFRRVGLNTFLLTVFTVTPMAVLRWRYNLNVADIVAAVMAVVTAYLAWETYRSSSPGTTYTLPGLADSLAERVKEQWDREMKVRRIYEPYALTISWKRAPGDLVENWDEIEATANSLPDTDEPHHEDWAAGPEELERSDNQLYSALSRVPTRRLIVLGEPGAGKTVLLIRLVQDLIERRSLGDPVPMLLSLASWNPSEEDFQKWLIGRIIVDYPDLKNPTPSGIRDGNIGGALFSSGLLLLILDGLDEIPRGSRTKAIRQINEVLSLDVSRS